MQHRWIQLLRNPPNLKTQVKTKLDSTSTILVFESNLEGYNAVLDWCFKNHPQEPIFRLLIPYSPFGGDVWDHPGFTIHSLSSVLNFPETHQFELVPLPDLLKIQKGIEIITRNLSLRDPKTGLSTIQTYLLKAKNAGWSEEVVIAMAVAHTKLSLHQVKYEWSRVRFLTIDGDNILPKAVLSGNFPISVDTLARALVHRLLYRAFDWNSLTPPQFSKGNSCSTVVRDSENWIIALPHGVSRLQFALANPGCDRGTAWKEIYFMPHASELLSVKMVWNPEFIGQSFGSFGEYMEWWVECVLDDFVLEFEALFTERETQTRRQQFAHTFYVGSLDLQYKTPHRMFIHDSKLAKLKRIHTDFQGDETLLDLPVSVIDHEYIFAPPIEIPPLARDLWIKKLVNLYSNRV